ncbi:unnamed protein product [Spodoptera exigua]|nr:unnamed protein product [Spodoptera exigua]
MFYYNFQNRHLSTVVLYGTKNKQTAAPGRNIRRRDCFRGEGVPSDRCGASKRAEQRMAQLRLYQRLFLPELRDKPRRLQRH